MLINSFGSGNVTTTDFLIMFNRDNWALILVPAKTREEIRKIARTENKKMWEIVTESINQRS